MAGVFVKINILVGGSLRKYSNNYWVKNIPQLKLNEPGSSSYSDFYGSATHQMPLVDLYGLGLLSFHGLMKRRLESLKLPHEIRDEWWLRPYDTGDAVLNHPNGSVKLLLNAADVFEISHESPLINGSLALQNGVYESAKGLELKAEEAAQINGIPITAESMINHPILQFVALFLARGDPKLMMGYINAVNNYRGRSQGYETSMAIHLPKPEKVPTMRLLYMEGIANMSSIGTSGLDNELNRVIGFASRSLEAPARSYDPTTLEQRLVEVRRRFSTNAFQRVFPERF